MSLDVKPLFEPLQIRTKILRNRIVMPPMVVLRGLTGDDGVQWYARRAQGGAGLVIVESTPVTAFHERLTAANLAPLVDAVHDAGALIAIQLFPIGQDLRPAAPADLTLEQIATIHENYRTAVQVCAAAGFDGVEPHGAHGYLLNQFFSPVQNTRTGAYGGDLQGRMQMALEIVRAVRETMDAHAPEMLLLYRHTPVGRGYGLEESLALAEALVTAGVDVLDLSPSSIDAPGDHAAPFTGLGAPVIAVNELDEIDRALDVLNAGRADLVAIGRGLIADPDWPHKVAQGRLDEIVRCTRCDVACFGNLQRGEPVGCTQWR
jgi:2,4-dienoyl-CoA reductase-like NADH-dependent reductase (Old Yellow Enzyme family)